MYLIPLFIGVLLNGMSLTVYQPTQFKLYGALGEWQAEGDLHPGAYRSETPYLKYLRARAARDSSISSSLIMTAAGLNFLAVLIMLRGMNRKVRVSDADACEPSRG